MSMNSIDAKTLQRLFLAGANRINEQKEYINELNVFPVPDGDTGSNMSMTIMSAAKEVGAISEPTMKSVCKAISSGSLRGARGNSGVILSQLFRGFTRAVSSEETLGVEMIAQGFQRAVETAYKAVMKPKEGTILTVAKGMADKAGELVKENPGMELIPFAETVVTYGYEVLARTPDMLPVLKEAGVVDSGGQGLMEVLQGALDSLTGKVTEVVVPDTSGLPSTEDFVRPPISTDDIKFGYCTEFIVMLNEPMDADTENEFKKYLLSIGDSLVCVADDEICKVHVHTNHPGQAFEKGLTFGSLCNMKVDNMRIEHEEKLIKDAVNVAKRQREQERLEEEKKKAAAAAEPAKKLGFVAVSVGDGFTELFLGLGVDRIIEGGQTMNPSTEDILNAISNLNAENIIVLPNNKNIILAAEQARDLTEDKRIIVIPTKTIPQGIAAMVGYMPDSDVDTNMESMKESSELIASGEVTYAVRDTVINGKEIHNGDIMGIGDDGIAAVGTDLTQVVLDLVDTMADEDSELISLYYGSDVKKEDADEMASLLAEKYEDCEVETNYGGQPIYYYMLSVE
ncbi:MAG: DAK2 domain-containing protein [Eubacterium sp.]|nr:DAK2 domain-containing protein [Eubacterium sp.]